MKLDRTYITVVAKSKVYVACSRVGEPSVFHVVAQTETEGVARQIANAMEKEDKKSDG